ncbi:MULTISPECIES: aminoacyl-tRNA hydrolase [unclassified Kribbella]|uniref:aminoacyl-tRNA hydrolase n=1 Tax=unclassified Kribbella TaxID=2644121 RepID=UPI0033E4EB80
MADDVWLVVGLGNPGPSYARTRHNVGHLVADELAARAGGKWKQHKQVRAEVIETRISGIRTVLAKPRSYMNESGGPVSGLLKFFKVEPTGLVVVHDELDIDFGVLRAKFGGGDNGHNGLKSLRKSLGTGEYYRVRFGVGRPPGRQNPADFVLNEFSSTERKDLPFAVDRTADAVESLLTDGLEATQGKYNS